MKSKFIERMKMHKFSNAFDMKHARFCFVVIFSIIYSLNAHATQLEEYNDSELGCLYKISGLIQPGIAERVKELDQYLISNYQDFEILRDKRIEYDTRGLPYDDSYIIAKYSPGLAGGGGPMPRICFDSPGGDWQEGVKLAEAIRKAGFSTGVPRGAICNSACAIAFMGGHQYGAYYDSEGRVDRVLHPTGQLGFHVPQLLLVDRLYTREEAIRAYGIAVQAIARITSLRSNSDVTRGDKRFDFPESLLLSLLETDFEDMFYIDTVGKAARFGIIVAPVPVADEKLEHITINVCDKKVARLTDTEPHVSHEWESGYWWDKYDNREGFSILKHGDKSVYRLSEAGYDYDPIDPGGYALFNSQYGGSDDFMGCFVILNSTTQKREFPGYLPLGKVLIRYLIGSAWNYSYWYAFHTHHPETRIEDLDLSFWDSVVRFKNNVRQIYSANNVRACVIQASNLAVTNVDNYVNMRSDPNVSSRIVKRISRNEMVRAVSERGVTVTGSRISIDKCISACRSLASGNGDNETIQTIEKCISDHNIWYEVVDSAGVSGWISRHFLRAAE